MSGHLERLAVVGFGSFRSGPAVASSLANWSGERPTEIRTWDPDPERHMVMLRVAATLFSFTKSTHKLELSESLEACLLGSQAVVVCLDPNGLRRWGLSAEAAARRIKERIPNGVATFALAGFPLSGGRQTEWPPAWTEEQRRTEPLQLIRYLNGEEPGWPLLKEYADSPLRAWLNGTMA